MGKKNDYLTLEDSAQFLGKPTSWMKAVISRGEIGAKLSGGQWLIALRDLDKLRANLPPEPEKVVHNYLAVIPPKTLQHPPQVEPPSKVVEPSAKRSVPAKDKPKELKLRYKIRDLDKKIQDLDRWIKAEYERLGETARSGNHSSKTVLNNLLFKQRQRSKQRQEAQLALAREQARMEQTRKPKANEPKKVETKQAKKKRVSRYGELERGQRLYQQIRALQRQIKAEIGLYEELKQSGEFYDGTVLKKLIGEREALIDDYARVKDPLGLLPPLVSARPKKLVQQKSKPAKRPSGQTSSTAQIQKVPPSPAIPTRHLSWRILPSGELSIETICKHYDRLQRQTPRIKYDRERIVKAFSLRPEQCYVGKNEFDGYIVFTFAHTSKALLECPIFGNAIYIINSDWKRWSRMSKQELKCSSEVTRIIHRGTDWFLKVKRELKIR